MPDRSFTINVPATSYEVAINTADVKSVKKLISDGETKNEALESFTEEVWSDFKRMIGKEFDLSSFNSEQIETMKSDLRDGVQRVYSEMEKTI